MRVYEVDFAFSVGVLSGWCSPKLLLRIQLNDGVRHLQLPSRLLVIQRKKESDGAAVWHETEHRLDADQVTRWCDAIDGLGLLTRTIDVEPIPDTSDVCASYQLCVQDLLKNTHRTHVITTYASGLSGPDAQAFNGLLRSFLGDALVEQMRLIV